MCYQEMGASSVSKGGLVVIWLCDQPDSCLFVHSCHSLWLRTEMKKLKKKLKKGVGLTLEEGSYQGNLTHPRDLTLGVAPKGSHLRGQSLILWSIG